MSQGWVGSVLVCFIALNFHYHVKDVILHSALVQYISSAFNSKPINHFNQSTAEILREITGAQQSRRIKMSNSVLCIMHTLALNVNKRQPFMHEVHPANQDSGDC